MDFFSERREDQVSLVHLQMMIGYVLNEKILNSAN